MQPTLTTSLDLLNFLNTNATNEQLERFVADFPQMWTTWTESRKKFLGDFEIVRQGKVSQNNKKFLGKNVLSYFDRVKAKSQNFYLNNYIKDILDPLEIDGHEEIMYTTYRLVQVMTNQEIQDTAKKHDIHVVDNAYVAIEKTIDMFLQGDNPNNGTPVFSYFLIGATLCGLNVFRDSDDDASVYLFRVDLDGVWGAGYAVGFSNKILES